MVSFLSISINISRDKQSQSIPLEISVTNTLCLFSMAEPAGQNQNEALYSLVFANGTEIALYIYSPCLSRIGDRMVLLNETAIAKIFPWDDFFLGESNRVVF